MRSHFRTLQRGVSIALFLFVSSSVTAQPNGTPPPPPGAQRCTPPEVMGSDFKCHCPSGTRPSGGSCVSDKCPSGQTLDPEGQCQPIVVKPCPEGKTRNASGQCVIACVAPRKLDANGRCA
jgi:hypothetical protein